ncbi:hypothetical protein ANN_16889 [Periplaneta americana]|uniref:Uncharacterized protein n=1 Tax=Periplaneta americana TaxID=6978 RepID=A0ABQ8SST5_PERAM|nr:hypothetical protein ANN_16889 [Periplaneta americana]
MFLIMSGEEYNAISSRHATYAWALLRIGHVQIFPRLFAPLTQPAVSDTRFRQNKAFTELVTMNLDSIPGRSVKVAGYTTKNKKDILYPNIPSAIRPIMVLIFPFRYPLNQIHCHLDPEALKLNLQWFILMNQAILVMVDVLIKDEHYIRILTLAMNKFKEEEEEDDGGGDGED